MFYPAAFSYQQEGYASAKVIYGRALFCMVTSRTFAFKKNKAGCWVFSSTAAPVMTKWLYLNIATNFDQLNKKKNEAFGEN